jgi:hypothetical protein
MSQTLFRDFYAPKYRSEFIDFLKRFIAKKSLRHCKLNELRKRYYAIKYRLQKEK